jgi:hypothetical protein
MLVVFSLSDNLSGGDAVYSIVSSLANISSSWRNGGPNGSWGLFTSSIISNFPTDMPVNGTVVASVRASNAYGLEFRLNGVRQSFVAPPSYSYTSAGNFVIGVSDSISRSNAFQGSINSLAFFDEVLSDAELISQEEYLRWRYGFIYNPDAEPLTYSRVLHSERNSAWLLEDGAEVEAD